MDVFLKIEARYIKSKGEISIAGCYKKIVEISERLKTPLCKIRIKNLEENYQLSQSNKPLE